MEPLASESTSPNLNNVCDYVYIRSGLFVSLFVCLSVCVPVSITLVMHTHTYILHLQIGKRLNMYIYKIYVYMHSLHSMILHTPDICNTHKQSKSQNKQTHTQS